MSQNLESCHNERDRRAWSPESLPAAPRDAARPAAFDDSTETAVAARISGRPLGMTEVIA